LNKTIASFCFFQLKIGCLKPTDFKIIQSYVSNQKMISLELLSFNFHITWLSLVGTFQFIEVNEMLRILSWVLVIGGFITLSFAGYQLWSSSYKENQRLSEAEAMLSTREDQDHALKENVADIEYETGDTIGLLYIPKLDREIPIIEGTDEDELAQGVGHYHDTGLPGQNRQILLSGHR